MIASSFSFFLKNNNNNNYLTVDRQSTKHQDRFAYFILFTNEQQRVHSSFYALNKKEIKQSDTLVFYAIKYKMDNQKIKMVSSFRWGCSHKHDAQRKQIHIWYNYHYLVHSPIIKDREGGEYVTSIDYKVLYEEGQDQEHGADGRDC